MVQHLRTVVFPLVTCVILTCSMILIAEDLGRVPSAPPMPADQKDLKTNPPVDKNPADNANNDNAQTAKSTQSPDPSLQKMDPQMQAVMDQLAKLNPKPIESLSPEEARKQPTPTDAVIALLKSHNKSTEPEAVGRVETKAITGPEGHPLLQARVYTPKGDGPFPIIVYYRGGGWVIATLDTYDASCRAMCNLTQAIVMSIDYRISPENKFPAAHEDAYAALQWALKSAKEINGDTRRVVVMGESAGGNMAGSVCLLAQERNGSMPLAQVLIYPITQVGLTETPSVKENANAKPLNKPMLPWFAEKYFKDKEQGLTKTVTLLNASQQDCKGLPPATIITAQIDPLMSEGKLYADKLKAAGVDAVYQNYTGVTHEFFGMSAVLDKAKEAQKLAADRIKLAFESVKK